MVRRPLVLAATALLVAAAACGKKAEPPKPQAPFKVQSVELGKSVGANKRVLKAITVFGPRDTIYAAMYSTGASKSVTMTATFKDAKGATIGEHTQTVAPVGPAATEFHISNAKGWPVGKYTVTLGAAGAGAPQTTAYTVKK